MEWRSISGFSRYEVSEIGQIRLAVDVMMPTGGCSGVQGVRKPKGTLLGMSKTKNGYIKTVLKGDNGKYKNIMAHRAVAEAFIEKNGDRNFVCHKNGVRSDNRADNLYWGTPRENSADMWTHGTILTGERAPANKLSAQDVGCIRECRAEGIPLKPLAEWFMVGLSTISSVTNKQNWKWL